MRQFVVTTTDGRMYGLVLDSSPMTDGQAASHVAAFGARTPGDLVAWSRYLAGERNGWTLAELVGRDRTWSRRGAALRPHSYCRVVTSSAVQSTDAAEAA